MALTPRIIYSASVSNVPLTDLQVRQNRQLPNGIAVASFSEGNSWSHFSATTTGTQIKTGIGTLVAIFIGTQVASGVIAAYDNVAGTTNLIASISTISGGAPVFLPFGTSVANGIWLVISGGNPDVTVTYL